MPVISELGRWNARKCRPVGQMFEVHRKKGPRDRNQLQHVWSGELGPTEISYLMMIHESLRAPGVYPRVPEEAVLINIHGAFSQSASVVVAYGESSILSSPPAPSDWYFVAVDIVLCLSRRITPRATSFVIYRDWIRSRFKIGGSRSCAKTFSMDRRGSLVHLSGLAGNLLFLGAGAVKIFAQVIPSLGTYCVFRYNRSYCLTGSHYICDKYRAVNSSPADIIFKPLEV